jgi:hypothetical protein
MFIAKRYLASMILAAMPCASLADFPQGLSMTVAFCDTSSTITCGGQGGPMPDFEFPALAVNFGVTKQAAISNSSAGAAKPSFENLMIEKSLGGPESPALFLGAAQGASWQQVRINIKVQNGDEQVAFVDLFNVQIPSYKTMINTNTASELVELSFSRICLTTFDSSNVSQDVCWDVFNNNRSR